MENNSPDLIQERMQETRNSLTDKVAMLEDHVMGTVQTATDAVQSTVEAVKDTMQGVKSSVEETVSTVASTVRDTFDISAHVRENPWLALGIAVASGFAAGRVIFPGNKKLGERMRVKFEEPPPPMTPVAGQYRPARERTPSWFDRLMDRAGDELVALGESAMQKAMAALKQSVDEGVPRLISEVEHRITGHNGHGNGLHGKEAEMRN